LESFLTREAALGRDDLIFPILYIDVPALDDAAGQQDDPVLAIIAKRQYVDWREFRYLDVNSTEVRREVGRLCTQIRDALRRSWVSPQERKRQAEAAAQRQAEAAAQRQAEAAVERQAQAERQRQVEEARQKVVAEQQRFQREAEARPRPGRRTSTAES
jgi:hypothetical protein